MACCGASSVVSARNWCFSTAPLQSPPRRSQGDPSAREWGRGEKAEFRQFYFCTGQRGTFSLRKRRPSSSHGWARRRRGVRACVVLGSGRFSLDRAWGPVGASEGCWPPRGASALTHPRRHPNPGFTVPAPRSPLQKGPLGRAPKPFPSTRPAAGPARPAPFLRWPRRGRHPRPQPGAPTHGGRGGSWPWATSAARLFPPGWWGAGNFVFTLSPPTSSLLAFSDELRGAKQFFVWTDFPRQPKPLGEGLSLGVSVCVSLPPASLSAWVPAYPFINRLYF